MKAKEKESMIYRIEFTTTLEIEADNEDKAIEIATTQLENEIKEDGLNQFYIYVNNKPYN